MTRDPGCESNITTRSVSKGFFTASFDKSLTDASACRCPPNRNETEHVVPTSLGPLAWLLSGHLTVLVLLMARVGGLVALAPFYGSAVVPVRVRCFLGLLLALVMLPVECRTSLPQPETLVELAAAAGFEALVGLALGLGVRLLFAGVQLAGGYISSLGGTSLARVLDPSSGGPDGGGGVPAMSQFLYLFAIVIFLTLGGHRELLAALLRSLDCLPLGAGLGTGLAQLRLEPLVIGMLTTSFELCVRVAAPAIAALLLATLVMGLVSRALPQLNLLVLGLGGNALVSLGAVALSLGAVAWALQDELQHALAHFLSTFGAPGPPPSQAI